MSRRRAVMAARCELPAGYRRCKYLESSRVQWIDTLITPVFGDVIHTRAERIGKDAPLFYAGTKNQVGIVPSEYGYYRNAVYTKYFQGASYAVEFPTKFFNIDSAFHDLVFGPNGLFVDGVNVCGISNDRMAADSSLRLFRNHKVYGFARMASFTLERDGQVLLELIPALDASGKPNMYDTVSGNTFYNKGTGEFRYELMDGTYVTPV